MISCFFFLEGLRMSAPPWAKNYWAYAQIKQQMAWELRLNKVKVAKKTVSGTRRKITWQNLNLALKGDPSLWLKQLNL